MSKKLLILSLPYILSLIIPANAALRVSNAARNQANQYNYTNPNTTTYTDDLPIAIPDDTVRTAFFNEFSSADGIDELNSCSMIYPTGEFAWDFPEMGLKSNSDSTCVAVVELRSVKGSQDIVVARANLAAGDTINCNISDFPEFSYTNDAGNVTFPADDAPTIEDVVDVMNQEQKQNAGLKIAAGVIIGALGGNAGGANDAGNTNLLGNDKGKIKGTVVGGLTGGAIMAGNSYAGKVGGDVILSAGVNAAAGALVGNMTAMSNSVLYTTECTNAAGETSECLWGIVEEKSAMEKNKTAFYNSKEDSTIVCDEKGDEYNGCSPMRLIGIVFEDGTTYEDAFKEQFKNLNSPVYEYDAKTKTMTAGTTTAEWFLLESASIPGNPIAAIIPNFEDKKAFGLKMTDWYEWRGENSSAKMYLRDSDGALGRELNSEQITLSEFYPLMLDSTDGKLIDIGNEARLKNTLIGAGTGAGLGAFTAYQGANDEINARWVTATQEYKDSLQKFYCGTGTRFLSSYNDAVIIPNMKSDSE